MQKIFIYLFLFWSCLALTQEKTEITFVAPSDTLKLSKTAINPNSFKIVSKNGDAIDNSAYEVNFTKGYILFNNQIVIKDSLQISFKTLPSFLTKTYQRYDDSKLINTEMGNQFIISEPIKKTTSPIFDGLQTAGTLARGIAVGNNQDATVNSNLDLQITGKLSNNVSIRASLQDSNIPLQNDGYSQTLDEFDQIFVELFSNKWNIRAGDLFLENREQRFLNFNKKVQGISSNILIGKQSSTTLTNGASLVRGQYAKSTFVGNEGNQGPYKLKGPNNELFVLVISGSERVFVNGNLLTRGENNDYIIDYNAGEIIFTPLFPITSEMRINIEYQYTDRNYTRFLTYNGFKTKKENWQIGSYFYTETDVKNQPLQQNLSEQQVSVLQQAGDNSSLMFSDSGVLAEEPEGQITYKKVNTSTAFYYEYSTDLNEDLYKVRFRFVGDQLGNYKVSNNQTLEKIYTYVAPIDNVPQGNYEPTVALIPPIKKQIATIFGKYNPNNNTLIEAELATSNSDNNLFSTLDDKNNTGIASWLTASHNLNIGSSKNKINAYWQYLHPNFNAIERINNIEFNRNWNLPLQLVSTKQNTLSINWETLFSKNKSIGIETERLDLGNFKGQRYNFIYNLNNSKTHFTGNTDYVSTKSEIHNSQFTRSRNRFVKQFKNKWTGTEFNLENNKEKEISTGKLTAISQQFTENHFFSGIGDSTNVYTQIGYKYRVNDSIRNENLERVNSSNVFYLRSQLLKQESRNLNIFINYRTLKYTNNQPKIATLNSRINYNDSFLKRFLEVNTTYETRSGTIAQQEFTYIEVNPGQGVYMWIDYNENGIQELQEFEIAPYPDLALYVRVFLPNQNFIKTHTTGFSQNLNLNFATLTELKSAKWISKFYNQTTYLIEKKERQVNTNLEFNPFSSIDFLNTLGLNYNFRNSLFFNRGKKKHFTTYIYQESENRNNLVSGLLSNQLKSHQLLYQHWVTNDTQLSLSIQNTKNGLTAEDFNSRNFNIQSFTLNPKVTYLVNNNVSGSIFGTYVKKQNEIGNLETLSQFKIGTNLLINSSKGFSFSGSYTFINNTFDGNANGAVGFTMLEGLQAAKNSTWTMFLQKAITQYLDLTINYQGRSGEIGKTIHNGTVQLRMNF